MKQFFGRWVLAYFRFFARRRLNRNRPLIIGITGSAGKTSTRNAVAAVLRTSTQLKVSIKANSESGIPLNILDLRPADYSPWDWIRMLLLAPFRAYLVPSRFNTYVVEMGIDSPKPPKNMDYLLSIIQPQIGIFLNALPVHTAAFDPGVSILNPSDQTQAIIDAIAQEKSKLVLQLPKDGLAVLNADDAAVMKHTENVKATVLTFGKSSKADVRIASIQQTIDSTVFQFTYQNQIASLKLPYVLPYHFGHTFAAALCVSIFRRQSLIEGCAQLQDQYKLPAGRMSLFRGVNDSVIIDSSYNASAQPTIDALEMLAVLPAKRHLALIGDMRELGDEAKGEHERVLDVAFRTADMIYAVGPLMEQFGLPYAQKQNRAIRWFAHAEEAGKFLLGELRQGDVVLVKGSQNSILMESAVEILLRDRDDVRRLCRRGAYWDKQRAKLRSA